MVLCTYYQGCTCVDRPEVRSCVRIIKVVPVLTGLMCGSVYVLSRLYLC